MNPIPSDGNICTHDGCLHNEPFYWPMPENTPCNDGKGQCDNGICSSCETKADCGADLACREFECDQGMCVAYDKPKGLEEATLICPEELADCAICTDTEDCGSATDCHSWTCVDAMCTPVNAVARTPCAKGVCSETSPSECVDCVDDAHCPGPDGDCTSCNFLEPGNCTSLPKSRLDRTGARAAEARHG